MTEQRQKCIVKYQVATYSGELIVYCDSNDDIDYIIAVAKKQLRQSSGDNWPFGYASFNIIEREYYYGD